MLDIGLAAHIDRFQAPFLTCRAHMHSQRSKHASCAKTVKASGRNKIGGDKAAKKQFVLLQESTTSEFRPRLRSTAKVDICHPRSSRAASTAASNPERSTASEATLRHSFMNVVTAQGSHNWAAIIATAGGVSGFTSVQNVSKSCGVGIEGASLATI